MLASTGFNWETMPPWIRPKVTKESWATATMYTHPYSQMCKHMQTMRGNPHQIQSSCNCQPTANTESSATLSRFICFWWHYMYCCNLHKLPTSHQSALEHTFPPLHWVNNFQRSWVSIFLSLTHIPHQTCKSQTVQITTQLAWIHWRATGSLHRIHRRTGIVMQSCNPSIQEIKGSLDT